MEKYFREKTNEIIDKIKKDSAEKGRIITESEELLIRLGMSYGISLAAIGLSELPYSVTFNE